MRVKELRPIREKVSDYEEIESRIVAVFLKHLYRPLFRVLHVSSTRVTNAKDSALARALKAGYITYDGDRFTGTFISVVSRELRQLGAKWRAGAFVIDLSQLPPEILSAISAGTQAFNGDLKALEAELTQILPEKIADSLETAELFRALVWKTDKELRKTIKGLAIIPELTKPARQQIADDWQTNLDLWITDFSAEEIKRLRDKVFSHTFKGNRREALISHIERSYGVTKNKAKFLARQETSLLVAKLRETRYVDAGIRHYRWRCVKGSPKHPVRPAHKALDGTVHQWNDPPITTEPGEPVRRNNPGQDYNCRCTAVPLVKMEDT